MKNHEGHEGHESKRAFVFFVFFVFFVVNVFAQQLLDRIVARVNSVAITLSDVKAAVALGIVKGDPNESAAIEPLVDRQLMLAEVARFVPPEPPAEEIDRAAAAIKASVGPKLPALMESTGVDEGRIREIAREDLRVQAYLDQRFGTGVQLTEDEVERYYRIHPDEFTRDGRLMPFVEAEPSAREHAALDRRTAQVAQWLRDLRARAEIIRPTARP